MATQQLNSFLLRAYRRGSSYDPRNLIKQGDLYKDDLKPIKTPLKSLDVRWGRSGSFLEYYLYDKAGDCVGVFSIEESDDPEIEDFSKDMVKKDVKVFVPHLSLAPSLQGQGVGSFIYRAFLLGKRVFVTSGHAKAAGFLWDKLSKTSGIKSGYWEESVLKAPTKTSMRFIGMASNFK